MQFIVTGRDGQDEGALDRRLACRAQHIEVCDELFENGSLLVGFALLDASGKMCGSTMVFETSSRDELDAILSVEPYVVNGVWQSVEVQQCQTGPTFKRLFDR